MFQSYTFQRNLAPTQGEPVSRIIHICNSYRQEQEINIELRKTAKGTCNKQCEKGDLRQKHRSNQTKLS